MKIKSPRTACALCLGPGPLCRSHIISEFLYSPSYDSKHRLHVITTNPADEAAFEQKGLRERMLCNACEGRFSRYELHAKEVLFGGKVQVKPTGYGFGRIHHVDFALFRLFVLSLIWRMSESILDIFANVDLGPHAEIIRRALLSDDPLLETQYPFVLTAVKLKGTSREDMILEPDKVRVDHYQVYRFIVRGLLICVFVSKQPPPPDLAAGILRRSGDLLILEQEADQIPYLSRIFNRIGEAMRMREHQA